MSAEETRPSAALTSREEVVAVEAGVTRLRGKGCTTLDHIWPGRVGGVEKGTPCYCGARKWGEE